MGSRIAAMGQIPQRANVKRYTRQRKSELGMLLLASGITILAFLLASLGINSALPSNLIIVLVAMVALPLVVHIANLFLAPYADPALMPIVALLNGLGYVMIARLDPQEALLQGVWATLGVIAYISTLIIVNRSEILDRYRFLLALSGLLLLVLPLAPGIGQNINGARLWIRLGPVSFQPVEIAKLNLAIFFASYFIEKRDVLGAMGSRLSLRESLNIRILGPIATAWIASLLVMTLERDVGFSLMLFLVFIITIWMATSRIRYLFGGSILFVLGALGASNLFTQVNVRVTIWIDPWKYAQGIGYQIVQAQYALAAGGISGTGLGRGHPTIIPVVTSDFIFAAIGEEMGLLGTSAIVMAFLLIVGIGIRAALRAKSPFGSLIAAIFTMIIGLQSFFIMGGIVRLLPLTGVTLPFVAYGGSSLISNYILISILMRISDEGNRPDELENELKSRRSLLSRRAKTA
ncbi:FtsW/RodA/SpoVE family cell cycle protein [Acidithrix ferrooxidans]|uniref:Lipid II flippase FtsW n=1 Tax=Acidithrix ferrooxidans TaxID=1280514 RepID=A0A0D8HHS8_9ACTN|nr:FtsW/RodA/SpoVE family cell cycle protein [Acidithrix ferrooxidans]KJF17473.1 lipid II flippase FtsW [Acidithrix ferrooxidans]